MAEQQIVMKVPEEIIDAQVRSAVAQALGKNADVLVRAIVDRAISKKQDNYSRTTIFQDELDKMIRAVANESLAEWLEELRPEIRKQVRATLDKRKREQVAKMADRLLDSLSNAIFYVNVKNSD